MKGNESFLEKEMKFARRWLYSKNIMIPQEAILTDDKNVNFVDAKGVKIKTQDSSSTWVRANDFAAEAIAFENSLASAPARLVLIDAMELAWQRAKYRGHRHRLLPADRAGGT